jgi:hypothetical protein
MVYSVMPKPEQKMTFDEMHKGTVPATMRSDGSKWRIWARKGTAYCKWIDGPVPDETPFKAPLDSIDQIFDVDTAKLGSLA